jgi:enoyl-CoA hydratase/carnithine racemase
MWTELRRIGRDLPADIRIVVVRGEGRAFSAGLDLSAVRGDSEDFSFAELATRDDAIQTLSQFQEAFSWLRRPDLVSIAAVRGHAIGAGFQLALACDLRIVAEDAQFTMAEVSLGLVPDLTGTKRLVDLVGYARALEICLTGRRIGASEADRLGLCTSVVPRDDLDRAVDELVAQILAAHRDAVIEIKALLVAAGDRDATAQEAAEREAQLRRLRDLAGLGE